MWCCYRHQVWHKVKGTTKKGNLKEKNMSGLLCKNPKRRKFSYPLNPVFSKLQGKRKLAREIKNLNMGVKLQWRKSEAREMSISQYIYFQFQILNFCLGFCKENKPKIELIPIARRRFLFRLRAEVNQGKSTTKEPNMITRCQHIHETEIDN